jgi:hypothetical protein
MTLAKCLTSMVVLTLFVACGDQQSAVQPDDPAAPHESERVPQDAVELKAHSPRGSFTAALLAAPPAYAQLDDALAEDVGGALKLSVDAGGEIPRQPDDFIQSVAVLGYAWADRGSGRGLVAVIHPTIGRDS